MNAEKSFFNRKKFCGPTLTQKIKPQYQIKSYDLRILLHKEATLNLFHLKAHVN